MKRCSGPPILVTGSHRSGTTWVGALLASSGEIHNIHEPFNPGLYRAWSRVPMPAWFMHIDAHNSDIFEADAEAIVTLRPPAGAMWRRAEGLRQKARVVIEVAGASRARRSGKRPLMKDPIALLSAEWLNRRFGVRPLVLVRHPAAFLSSILRLGWRLDFSNLSRQEHLLDDLLEPFAAEIEAAVATDMDLLDNGILQWRVFNHVVAQYRQRHPDWLVMRYEDLAADPLGRARGLYHALGLTWTDEAARAISDLSASNNVAEVDGSDRGGVRRDSSEAMWTWLSRLSTAQVGEIRERTADVAEAFYSEADWQRAGNG